MPDPEPNTLAQVGRFLVLLQRWWRLRVAMVRLDAAQRAKAFVTAVCLGLVAVLMLVIALALALFGLAALLQSMAGLTPAAAYGVVALVGIGLALVLAFIARAGLRHALRPITLQPIKRDRRS